MHDIYDQLLTFNVSKFSFKIFYMVIVVNLLNFFDTLQYMDSGDLDYCKRILIV